MAEKLWPLRRLTNWSLSPDPARRQRTSPAYAELIQQTRVNLPTRGLRYAFTQVLQTETGKALTVNFTAANSKSVNWPKRISGGLAGFAALWAVVALVTARSTKRERQA